jgi:hypothetical protein
VLLLAFGLWVTYITVSRMSGMREGIRWGLCVLLGGLIGYNYLALGLPGSLAWSVQGGLPGVLAITLFGELAGLGGAWLLYIRSRPRAS